MSRMDKQELVFEEIRDEHLDMMIKLALKQADAEGLLNGDICEGEPVSEEEARRTFDLFLQKYTLMKEQKLQEERRRARRSLLRVVTRVFVCVILCLAVLTPIALAAIPSLRQQVAELLIVEKEDHIEVQLSRSSNTLVPEGWNGNYFPSYIPERYHLSRVNQFNAKAIYIDADNYIFYYSESDENEKIQLDSEDAYMYYNRIGAHDVLVLEEDEFVTFVWTDGELVFVISGAMTIDEAKAIYNSLVKV